MPETEGITISTALLEKLERRNVLLVDAFRFSDEIVGEYKVENLLERRVITGNAELDDDVNAFSLVLKSTDASKNTQVILPDFLLMRALVLGEEPELNPVKSSSDAKMEGVDKVGYYDENPVITTKNKSFTASYVRREGGDFKDLKLPSKIKIAGALVNKVDYPVEDGKVEKKPATPLRLFRHYNEVLAYHRKQTGKKDDFITRDQFQMLLAQHNMETSEVNIPNVPKGAKFELISPELIADPGNWTVRLMIMDVK